MNNPEQPESSHAVKSTPVDIFPRDLFLHLFATIMLYASVWELLSMLFHFCDLAFPDSASEGWGSPQDSIRFAVATLVFAFPAYLWSASFVARDLAADPTKVKIWTVRCPFYLTIFLAGLTLVGDLIDLLYYLLRDEVTAPFILKVLAVLVVTGAVFVYYLNETRLAPDKFLEIARPFAITATIVVAVCVIAGIVVVGPMVHPWFSRADERRIRDLKVLEGRVTAYWKERKELPDNLLSLADPRDSNDPATSGRYEYSRMGAREFELCAQFLTASPGHPENAYQHYETSWNWEHGSGNCCFRRKIDGDSSQVHTR
ncbi:MAG: DUF5671 domain-containing protein [Candidatus Binataceae bacterium]|jgi:hypothetical protein